MKFFRLAIVFTLISIGVHAQPGGGGPGGDPDVPLGGIEILIAAGAILGTKKVLDQRKTK